MHGRKIDGEECLRPSELPMAVVQKKLFVPKINFGLEDIVFLLNSRSSDWILSLREFPLSVSHCLWARRSPICKDIEESLLFCANCDEIGCERRVSNTPPVLYSKISAHPHHQSLWLRSRGERKNAITSCISNLLHESKRAPPSIDIEDIWLNTRIRKLGEVIKENFHLRQFLLWKPIFTTNILLPDEIGCPHIIPNCDNILCTVWVRLARNVRAIFSIRE